MNAGGQLHEWTVSAISSELLKYVVGSKPRARGGQTLSGNEYLSRLTLGLDADEYVEQEKSHGGRADVALGEFASARNLSVRTVEKYRADA